MELLRGQEPFLELRNEFLLLLSGFDFSEALEIGMREKFAGEWAIIFEEEKGGFLEARLSGDGEHARPPGGAREIFAGEREFLEIIFEEKKCAL